MYYLDFNCYFNSTQNIPKEELVNRFRNKIIINSITTAIIKSASRTITIASDVTKTPGLVFTYQKHSY